MKPKFPYPWFKERTHIATIRRYVREHLTGWDNEVILGLGMQALAPRLEAMMNPLVRNPCQFKVSAENPHSEFTDFTLRLAFNNEEFGSITCDDKGWFMVHREHNRVGPTWYKATRELVEQNPRRALENMCIHACFIAATTHSYTAHGITATHDLMNGILWAPEP